MGGYRELRLADGSSVRVEVTPAGPGTAGDRSPDALLVPAARGREDLPEGFGDVEAVSRRREAAAAEAAETAEATLASVLGPLGSVLCDVRDAVTSVPHPPQQLDVTFGVQVGADLKLGIVGASGQCSFTVTASWHLPDRA